METVRLFGFDITPRKVYRQALNKLQAENRTLKSKLADQEKEQEDLKSVIDEMIVKNLELRKANKSLREQLPTRDNNGRFSKKNNK